MILLNILQPILSNVKSIFAKYTFHGLPGCVNFSSPFFIRDGTRRVPTTIKSIEITKMTLIVTITLRVRLCI